MLLATTKVEDFDRFVQIYSTKGAEKRRQHGSKGSTVFRDPNEEDRIWAIFDWDAEGWQRFASDPDVPGIMQLAGHKGRPRSRSSAAGTTPERSDTSPAYTPAACGLVASRAWKCAPSYSGVWQTASSLNP